MNDCEEKDEFLKSEIKNRSTPIKFLLDESSLFEFEANEKLAQDDLETTRHSLYFKEPIDQLEKMIQNINSSNLDFTLESLNQAVEDDNDSNTRLENEIKKRIFLERKITELNSEKLDLTQKLNLTEDKLNKKISILKNFESLLAKTVEKWKLKESDFVNIIEKVKSEKHSVSIELTKMTMKNQLLEQEMKKIGDDLVSEKVKGQEYQNQIASINKQIDQLKIDLNNKESEIDSLGSEIESLGNEKSNLEDELHQVKSELSKSNLECQNYKTKFDGLNEKNQSLIIQNDNLKLEYENLINEAKSVIEESERQYSHLTQTIESEKLKKDTLQVEMNMLEEKYEIKIKNITNEYEAKMNNSRNSAIEKERDLLENHRSEIEQIRSKAQYDLDKLKYKMSEDFKEITNDYESKVFNLNLKIDSLQNDITRLEAANYDLENERNTIRRNLKQQLEMQMKETFEILGLENENANKFKNMKSNSVNNLQKISKLESSSCFSLSNVPKYEKYDKLNASLQYKTTSPILESFNSSKLPKEELTEPKPVIKDAFIINQIDLINKYYQIDNSTIKAAVAASNQNLFNEEIDVTCHSSPKKEVKNDTNNSSMNTSRSSELKHYIELLLNKQPTVVETDKEIKHIGYNDLSDIELGYTKKQSSDYYDDVKRNLNFDFDSETEQDDSYDETENSINKNQQIINKKLATKSKMITKSLKNRK
ncbi:unnamed protein product [Brachionus calyciflorus]|uniref:Uncharacterized protein n=1 Tax=Brachionus calyciflorus TaxID=104777 RepID=A0A813MIX2_9BILA|nr:unnamed protein product [Brachionus calyciflorus]